MAPSSPIREMGNFAEVAIKFKLIALLKTKDTNYELQKQIIDEVFKTLLTPEGRKQKVTTTSLTKTVAMFAKILAVRFIKIVAL